VSQEPHHGGSRRARSELASQAQQVKDEITRLTTDLQRAEATGSAGGGLVRAVIAGDGKLVALDLDPSVIDPNDPGSLASLVMEAVNDAASALVAQRVKRIAPLKASLRDIVTDLNGQGRTAE
jgi:DNA-binding YbaB/EbfC family protein